MKALWEKIQYVVILCGLAAIPIALFAYLYTYEPKQGEPPAKPEISYDITFGAWSLNPMTCRDGWKSPSIGERGACSHHGGVADWSWSAKGSDGYLWTQRDMDYVCRDKPSGVLRSECYRLSQRAWEPVGTDLDRRMY